MTRTDDTHGWRGQLARVRAFFARDIWVSSALTRQRYGWRPVQPTLLEDFEKGHYFSEQEPPR